MLLGSRNALERSPSMTRTLNVETIRDLLLVSLNANFEGKAGAEMFNGAGKTDILVREGDRNIFIGECKIWRGQADHRRSGPTAQLPRVAGQQVSPAGLHPQWQRDGDCDQDHPSRQQPRRPQTHPSCG